MEKLIAIAQVGKSAPGEEFEVASNVANVLVLLGKARRVTEPKAPAPRRGRGRAAHVAPASAQEGDGTVGAITTANIKQPAQS